MYITALAEMVHWLQLAAGVQLRVMWESGVSGHSKSTAQAVADLLREPVGQMPHPLRQHTAIERHQLRDVDHRVVWEP